ncbi:PilZ domain-containing protein [Pseudoxanthomonas mexicana]|uniref:PilZ domain-containing protein n=1 Tax=Pseudoxanthomonas mexicana TaxID=128785 RepID=UPI00398AB456
MIPTPAIEHPAETELFAEALTCDVVLPARFDPALRPLQPQAAEALLLGLAVAEDVRSEDKDDHRNELPQTVQRMEAKLDLLVGLLGRLARQREGALPLRPLRWSHRGLRLDLDAPVEVANGTEGVAMIEPAGWLGDYIELPASVLASIPGGTGTHHLWLRFGHLAPGLSEALERHLFRMHRKQIAEARQAALNAAGG